MHIHRVYICVCVYMYSNANSPCVYICSILEELAATAHPTRSSHTLIPAAHPTRPSHLLIPPAGCPTRWLSPPLTLLSSHPGGWQNSHFRQVIAEQQIENVRLSDECSKSKFSIISLKIVRNSDSTLQLMHSKNSFF